MKYNKLHFLLILGILVISLLQFTSITAYIQKEPDLPSNQALDTSGVFKIITYNLLEGGKNPEWKEIIRKENADILLLTETGLWSSDDGSINSAVTEINSLFPDETPYTGVTFIPDSVTDGQVILSRYPIVDTILLPVITLDDGSTWNINHEVIDAVIDINGLEVHFIVIHFTCCDGGLPSRLKEMEGIINYIDTLGDVPVVYAGDFNSDTPEDTGDLAPGSSSLGPEPIDMLINENNPKSSVSHKFVDVYRTLNPYYPGPTYVDPTFQIGRAHV